MGIIAPPKYTIIIAEQKGEYVIYPGSTTSWILELEDTIQFSNTTGKEITVNATPNSFVVGEGQIIIPAGESSNKKVNGLPETKTQLAFTFNIPGQSEVLTGGPKMVPTEPVGG